jgi:hypothetical protein
MRAIQIEHRFMALTHYMYMRGLMVIGKNDDAQSAKS